MKYSKDLEWLEPLVESVSDLVPLHDLVSIKGYRVHLGKHEGIWGRAIATSTGKVKISLRTHSHNHTRKYEALTVEIILLTLAHELAHLVHWNEHNQEFSELFGDILTEFIQNLTKTGIDDIQVAYDQVT